MASAAYSIMRRQELFGIKGLLNLLIVASYFVCFVDCQVFDWMEVGQVRLCSKWKTISTQSDSWISPLVLLGDSDSWKNFSFRGLVRNVAITTEGRVKFEAKVSLFNNSLCKHEWVVDIDVINCKLISYMVVERGAYKLLDYDLVVSSDTSLISKSKHPISSYHLIANPFGCIHREGGSGERGMTASCNFGGGVLRNDITSIAQVQYDSTRQGEMLAIVTSVVEKGVFVIFVGDAHSEYPAELLITTAIVSYTPLAISCLLDENKEQKRDADSRTLQIDTLLVKTAAVAAMSQEIKFLRPFSSPPVVFGTPFHMQVRISEASAVVSLLEVKDNMKCVDDIMAAAASHYTSGYTKRENMAYAHLLLIGMATARPSYPTLQSSKPYLRAGSISEGSNTESSALHNISCSLRLVPLEDGSGQSSNYLVTIPGKVHTRTLTEITSTSPTGTALSDGSAWAQATPGAEWSGRNGHATVVYNNMMWVLGGYNGASYTNDVWSSDDGVTWNLITSSADWSGRYRHSSVVYNNTMWVLGGSTGLLYINDVWSSVDGVTWTQVTSSAQWNTRYSHTSVVYNNMMWVLGGYNVGGYKNDVWSSVDGATWTQVTSSADWNSRDSHTSVVYNNMMWVLGGYGGISSKNDVWSSVDGATWTQVTSSAQWSARFSHTSVVYNNMMWVLGGDPNLNLANDVWSSDDGVTWNLITSSADWSGRYRHSSVVYKNESWVLGGADNTNELNDVWATVTLTGTPSISPTTNTPTFKPISSPTTFPTAGPTIFPTFNPTMLPTSEPTSLPTTIPSEVPTSEPTPSPTPMPSSIPTISCSEGSFVIDSSSQLCVCEPGYSSFDGLEVCTPCGGGSYSNSTGATSCRECTNGTYANSPVAATECSLCEPGFYSTSGATNCIGCDAGTFSNVSGASTCIVCGIGSYSEGNATECMPCPSGYFSDEPGSTSCAPCSAGYSSEEGSTECTICSAGTSAHEASGECTYCHEGEYAPHDGMKNCGSCEEGTYSHAGAIKCSTCPGLSWSGEKSGSCNQVKFYMTSVESMFMFFFLLAFVGVVAWSVRTTVPHALAVSISSFDFISDLSYVAYSPFYRPAFLVLSFVFIFLAMGHIVYMQYKRFIIAKSLPRQFFGHPGTFSRLVIVTSVEGFPWIENTRFFPATITQLSDFNSFLLFLVAWIVAATVQTVFTVAWICSHVVYQLPWMMVHVPYFFFVFCLGLFLTQTKLIMHRDVKRWWLHLVWSDPGLLYIGEFDTQIDVQALNESCIVELSTETCPQLIVQTINNVLTRHFNTLSLISVVSSVFMILSYMYRMIYWTMYIGCSVEDIPMPFGAKDVDNYIKQKKTESDLRKQAIASTKAAASYRDSGDGKPKLKIMEMLSFFPGSNPSTSDQSRPASISSQSSESAFPSFKSSIMMDPQMRLDLEREDWLQLVEWMVGRDIGRLYSYQYAQTLAADGVCTINHLARKVTSAGLQYLTKRVGMTEDHAAFVEQGLSDDFPEAIAAGETAVMKQWLMGPAGVSKSLSYSYAKTLIKLEVTSPRGLWEQIKHSGTSFLRDEVKMSNTCSSMVLSACQLQFGSTLADNYLNESATVFNPIEAALCDPSSPAAAGVVLPASVFDNLEVFILWFVNDVGLELSVACRYARALIEIGITSIGELRDVMVTSPSSASETKSSEVNSRLPFSDEHNELVLQYFHRIRLQSSEQLAAQSELDEQTYPVLSAKPTHEDGESTDVSAKGPVSNDSRKGE